MPVAWLMALGLWRRHQSPTMKGSGTGPWTRGLDRSARVLAVALVLASLTVNITEVSPLGLVLAVMGARSLGLGRAGAGVEPGPGMASGGDQVAGTEPGDGH